MSTEQTRPHRNREEIARCQLTASRRFNVSLRVYKSIKALTQLVAVGAGIFAMQQGSDPMTTFVIIGVIVSGPEVAEYYWSNTSDGGDEN